jgi:hypothetical protein
VAAYAISYPTEGPEYDTPHKHGPFGGPAGLSKTVSGLIGLTRVRIPPPPSSFAKGQ